MGESRATCGQCGVEAPPAARFCPGCGRTLLGVPAEPTPGNLAQDGSWNPDPGPANGSHPPHPDRPPRPDHPPRVDHPPRHEAAPRHEDPPGHEDVPRPEDVPRQLVVPAGHTVEGQVRNLQARTEQRGQSEYESVWTFRLERYDAAGQRVTLVPVEMRGISFEGGLGEGDWVRAHGTMKAGTFRVKRVENETTGAVVTAKGIPKGPPRHRRRLLRRHRAVDRLHRLPAHHRTHGAAAGLAAVGLSHLTALGDIQGHRPWGSKNSPPRTLTTSSARISSLRDPVPEPGSPRPPRTCATSCASTASDGCTRVRPYAPTHK